jgi:TIR domain
LSLGGRRFRYDAFISYSHRNRDWVRSWLVPQLKHAGLKVCIDYEGFEPGAPTLTEIERAVLQSRKTVLVLTPEYLQSEWTELENILVQTLDPAARQRRLIPILLLYCQLPLRIGSLTSIDFTRAEEHEEKARPLDTFNIYHEA